MPAIYKRILLKLSGEALAGEKGFGIDEDVIKIVAESIQELTRMRVEVAVVVGGGNIIRGRSVTDMDRPTGDYMGMLATVINSLALQAGLENLGVDTRCQTAIEMRQIAEPYIRRRAVRHLEKGRVVIFGGGIGNPYFSTDTTAALRAAEIEAEVILLAKNVDAVYDSDPHLNPQAERFSELTFREVLNRDLKVMDATATSLCKDNNIPIMVFSLSDPHNIIDVVEGKNIGTIIKGDAQ